MRTTTITTLAATALVLTGCARGMDTGAPMAGGRTATATLRTADGADAGRATATEVAGGIRFTADIKGLPGGTHGIHVHTVGACDAPGFTTAGGHWNPTAAKHGTMNPQGPHEGDLPNLILGPDGRGTVAATIPGAMMDALLDTDGAAIVVHAAADDLMTDPSGNSGGRIACGVFAAG
ncbi:superoxide dismutase family protein [Sphingomonas sp.]|uniref:superoxide dismutase family protein n=1 Tax=Sphingomonas sp. TaxID=28214 RepID=UPI0035BC5C14